MISDRIRFSKSMICFIFSALSILLLPLSASAYDIRINPTPDKDGYIIPHSAEERLYINEFTGLDIKIVELAKNEIYARHGLKFQQESMNSYFRSKSWYKEKAGFNKNSLNYNEAVNVRLLEDIMRNPQLLKEAETLNTWLLEDIARNPYKLKNVEIQTTSENVPLTPVINELHKLENANKSAKPAPNKNEQHKPANIGDMIVATARTMIAKPYRYGAADPVKGFDCSGLIKWVYQQHGINTPRSTLGLQKVGIHVPPNQMKPGDIVIITNRRRRDSPNGLHVGIYEGNDTMIHAPGRRRHVKSANLKHFKVKEGRRVI